MAQSLQRTEASDAAARQAMQSCSSTSASGPNACSGQTPGPLRSAATSWHEPHAISRNWPNLPSLVVGLPSPSRWKRPRPRQRRAIAASSDAPGYPRSRPSATSRCSNSDEDARAMLVREGASNPCKRDSGTRLTLLSQAVSTGTSILEPHGVRIQGTVATLAGCIRAGRRTQPPHELQSRSAMSSAAVSPMRPSSHRDPQVSQKLVRDVVELRVDVGSSSCGLLEIIEGQAVAS